MSIKTKKDKDQISMADISRMAGVSVATVSRVINQNGRFSEETRKRVEDIIKEYNYVPNMAAKGLKTKRSNFVGVIVPDITNEFFAKIVVEIQNNLIAEGYMALVCNTNEDEETEKEYGSMLSAVQLAGLIFISGHTSLVEQKMNTLPAIYIDRQPKSFDSKNSLVVESDNYGGARLAVQKLYEKGCKKIACVYASKTISTHKQRFEGYRDQLDAYGIKLEKELQIQVDEVSFLGGKKCIKKLLDSGIEFDGVFCATDWLALGALEALREKNVQVPEQVKVIGFDDISAAWLTAKPLTTIRQQVDVLGKMATQELIKLIQGEELNASRIEIGVSLVERQTT